MSIEITRATQADIKGILRLLRQVLEVHHKGRPDMFKAGATKYTENELTELLNDDERPVFVAKTGGRMLGYTFCIIKCIKNDNILRDTKTLYIDDLCVDEQERGAGIGRALYEHARCYAKEIDCYSLTLNVWECNPGARRFYEAMGLIPRSTRRRNRYAPESNEDAGS